MGGGKIRSYRDLDVWGKGILLSRDIYKVLGGYPEEEKFGIISQMQRAAVSVPANIAEGWARSGAKEFSHFLNIANGSLAELHTLLIVSKELGYIDQECLVSHEERVEELQKMIYSPKKSLTFRSSP